MGAQNDSINKAIPQQVHDAMNAQALALVGVFRRCGMDVERGIDFHPSTGEVIMSQKTVDAIAAFKREMREKNITIDKIMPADNLEAAGLYIWKDRVITKHGVVVNEGTLVDFIPMQAVEGEVTYKDGEESAAGVLV